MADRKDVMDTIRNTIRGLSVTVDGQQHIISTTNSLFSPLTLGAEEFPKFAVVPGPDPLKLTLFGDEIDHEGFQIDMFGYCLGGSRTELPVEGGLYEVSEALIKKITNVLTSWTFLNNIACTFSIVRMGPITSEHVDGVDSFAYISIPLFVQFTQTQDEV